MSAETEPAARRSHRDAVYDKAADAGRPEPVPLTEELCLEVAGEHPSSARVIELLFTSLEPLPALLCCEKLQELTLMHARMRRMPPELQHLRPTLRRLSLGGNEIEVIEHLDGMVRLHSLFLHENRIRSAAGLRGCTALERLWLNGKPHRVARQRARSPDGAAGAVAAGEPARVALGARGARQSAGALSRGHARGEASASSSCSPRPA